MLLAGFLEQSGTDVIITRADSSGIFDNSSGSIKQKKVSDMRNREKIMNTSDADLFISIHMNKFPESIYSGPQVFYSSNSNKSKLLAEAIQAELLNGLNPPSHREIKKADTSIYLLKKSTVPAVLVECGFLSNPAEEKLLSDAEYRKQLAWAIYKGIIIYYSNQ